MVGWFLLTCLCVVSAAALQKPKLLEYLLLFGADPSDVDYDDWTGTAYRRATHAKCLNSYSTTLGFIPRRPGVLQASAIAGREDFQDGQVMRITCSFLMWGFYKGQEHRPALAVWTPLDCAGGPAVVLPLRLHDGASVCQQPIADRCRLASA